MKANKGLRLFLTAAIFMTSVFNSALPIAADEPAEMQTDDFLDYFSEENLCFNSSDYWVADDDTSRLSAVAGWTSEQMPKFDGSEIHYIGIYPGKPVTMSEGYGKDSDWVAMQFNLTSWAHGDYAVYDIDGNVVFADCYASDGYWVGHGERSFGESEKVIDDYGIARLPNYLKTEVAEASELENTGKIAYGTDTLCTILIENQNGQIDDYSGEYYTVKVFKDDMALVSTEYHKGHINGIKTLENLSSNKDRNCFGDLKIYFPDGGAIRPAPQPTLTPKPTIDPEYISPAEDNVDTSRMIYGINFNKQNTIAYKGETIENGNFTYEEVSDNDYAAVFNGTDSYLSLKNSDGGNLLAGKDNLIITMKAKPEKGNSNGWYFYTSWNSAAQGNGKNGTRSYVGILDNSSEIIGERFRDSNSDPTIKSPTSLNEWQEITYVIYGNKSDMYINGVFCGEQTYSTTLSQLLGDGEDQVAYIGKANWGEGEYLKGAVDNIEIYDFAPKIDLGDISRRTEDIDLPNPSKEADGYTIAWSSSNENVITSDGKVIRPNEGKETVTLTATISFSRYTLTKNFEVTVIGTNFYDGEISISNKKGVDIQPNMYGLFFEDINYAADGGLYAEMVENRSFEQIAHPHPKEDNLGTPSTWDNPGYKWSAIEGEMNYTDSAETGLNANNTHYLNFRGKSFKTTSYDGMYIEKGKKYNVSLYAKSDSYTGGISVRTEKDGQIGFSGDITDSVTNEWKKYEVQLTAENDVRYSDFIVELDSEGKVDFDMISVMPDDAVCGVFRRDLAEKLKAMNPGFLRFPGGCVVEGWDLANAYRWKDTVGDVSQRKQNWNRWMNTVPFTEYNQTCGLGYYEYFLLCEYLGCDPLPVQNVGMGCQFKAGKFTDENLPIYLEDGKTYNPEFYEYIQDTLDLVEFANSTDFENSEWARLRRDMGHSEPFNLTMIGLGNEQWDDGRNHFWERYEVFEKEIHKVYPEMKLISTTGPSPDDKNFHNSWNWLWNNYETNENFAYAVDEHYYVAPQWFLDNDNRYDNYDRRIKVFAGEYAGHSPLSTNMFDKNNADAAISEAAYMTGLERNADVVYLASYAPLFARIGYVQWYPDMIWFNDAESYGTPSYYVQSMYSNNNGSYTLKNTVEAGIDKVYSTVCFDEATGDVIIKLVNPYDYDQRMSLKLDEDFDVTGTADCEIISAQTPADHNTIDDPENMIPVKSVIDNFTNDMDYMLPQYSFAVIRVHTTQGMVSVKECKIDDDQLTVAINENDDLSAADVIIAVYNKKGVLVKTVMNETELTMADIDPEENYEIKVMVWEKGTMKPLCDSVRGRISYMY